jgi:predicted Zn-ribbon and HTH transcriptional regulator
MPLDSLIFAGLVSMLAGLSAITLYSEMHRKRFEPRPTEDHIFRCEKCAFVYTDDADVDRSRCPQCGTVNDSIEF